MRVLDANFLIDYLNGDEDTLAYHESAGGSDQHWILPAPAYSEVLVWVGNLPDGDIQEAMSALSWGEVYEVDERISVLSGRIADEVGRQGPFLDGVDAMVAAVGRELDSPVVSADGDLTHPKTKQVVDVETYRR